MALKIKPKNFGPVLVHFDGTDISFGLKDSDNRGEWPPRTSPVDTLLASLGFCIVKSAQLAATQHKAVLDPFTVKVIGVKATDLPSRLDRINVLISGAIVPDASFAEQIVTQAKSICTVSNTLNCPVDVTIEG